MVYIIESQLLWDKFINSSQEKKGRIHTLFDPATIKNNADTKDYKGVIIGGLNNYRQWITSGPRVDTITRGLKKIIEAAGGEIDSQFKAGRTEGIFPFVSRATVKMIKLAIERINDKKGINAELFHRLTNDVLCLLNGLAFHHCCILKKPFPGDFVTCTNFDDITMSGLFFSEIEQERKFHFSPSGDESEKNVETAQKIRKRERSEEGASAELQAPIKNNKGEEPQTEEKKKERAELAATSLQANEKECKEGDSQKV
jgi:hypothetical protein